MAKKKGKKFISKAIKRPGNLHALLGVPQGQPIPAAMLAAAAKKPGLIGQEARFAENVLKPASRKRKKKK